MSHEFDGRKYEKSSAHQKEWGSAIIAELHLKGNERVLDLGCGDGTLTALLANTNQPRPLRSQELKPLRFLDAIKADILRLKEETLALEKQVLL